MLGLVLLLLLTACDGSRDFSIEGERICSQVCFEHGMDLDIPITGRAGDYCRCTKVIKVEETYDKSFTIMVS